MKKKRTKNEEAIQSIGTEENAAQSDIKAKTKKKKRAVRIFTLIALIIVIIILLLTKCDGSFGKSETVIVPVESNSRINENIDDIRIKINTMPEVKKGVIQNLNLENHNKGTHFVCMICVNGEVFHTLEPINCGEKIKSCRLYKEKLFKRKRLERGDYAGYARITCYDEKEHRLGETIIEMMFHVV